MKVMRENPKILGFDNSRYCVKPGTRSANSKVHCEKKQARLPVFLLNNTNNSVKYKQDSIIGKIETAKESNLKQLKEVNKPVSKILETNVFYE